MRRLLRLTAALAIATLAAGWSGQARAAMLPTIGRGVSGDIELFGKHVPLPPGQWWVASTGFGQVEDAHPGPYGAIGGVLLVRGEGTTQEFLLIHTNALPVRNGWGLPPECMDEQVLYRSVAEPRNEHNGCSFVAATRAGWLTHARVPALRDDPAVRALLPPWAVIAGLRVSDRRDVLDIRYGVVPPSLSASAWFGDSSKLQPAQQALVEGLGSWARKMRETAVAALRDPINQTPAAPALDLFGPMDMAAPDEGISTVALSLYKLATLRVPASMLSLALGWGLAGNFYTGLEVMAWQGLTHSAVFMANELVWEWPRSTPAMRFVGENAELPYVGPQARSKRNETITLAKASSSDFPLRAPREMAGPIMTYEVDGKLIPLPGKDWVVVTSDSADGVTATVLARLHGKALSGMAIARTNQQKRAAIFGTASDCSRGNISFAIVRYDTPEDGYCLYGKQVLPDPATPNNAIWAKATERLSAAGIAMPRVFLMVGARARTQENVLDIRYYFAPSPELIRDQDDTGLAPDPLAALQSWADLMQEPIELGVRGRPPSADLRAPWPWDADVVIAALVDQTHGPLLELAAANAFGQSTLDQQLTLADVSFAQRERQRWSLWSRSAYKAATYKAAGWVDSFATSWLVTSSPSQGFLFATISLVVRPAMQYANEIAWSRSSMGKAPASLVPVDYPEIGREFR